MKNATITLTLPDDLARWLRVQAGMRRGEDGYEVAMREFQAVKPRRMEWGDGRKPTREELHDRTGLR